MRFFKKILIGVLVLSLFCLYFPKIGLSGQSHLIAQADPATAITEHNPEILSLPEEDIPIEKIEEAGKGKKKKWGWYVLGGLAAVGLIAGAAAAAGGGGGGGGGGGNGPTTGDVTVSW